MRLEISQSVEMGLPFSSMVQFELQYNGVLQEYYKILILDGGNH